LFTVVYVLMDVQEHCVVQLDPQFVFASVSRNPTGESPMIQRTSTSQRVVMCCCLFAVATFFVAPGGALAARPDGPPPPSVGLPEALARIVKLEDALAELEEELDDCVLARDIAEGVLNELESHLQDVVVTINLETDEIGIDTSPVSSVGLLNALQLIRAGVGWGF
jgi:hypothetical protein